MKKVLFPILTALLVAAVFTGCRKNVATETTPSTTQATKPSTSAATTPSTAPTTKPTEAPQNTTRPSVMPDATGATGATGETGRSRQMIPHY